MTSRMARQSLTRGDVAEVALVLYPSPSVKVRDAMSPEPMPEETEPAYKVASVPQRWSEAASAVNHTVGASRVPMAWSVWMGVIPSRVLTGPSMAATKAPERRVDKVAMETSILMVLLIVMLMMNVV